MATHARHLAVYRFHRETHAIVAQTSARTEVARIPGISIAYKHTHYHVHPLLLLLLSLFNVPISLTAIRRVVAMYHI